MMRNAEGTLYPAGNDSGPSSLSLASGGFSLSYLKTYPILGRTDGHANNYKFDFSLGRVLPTGPQGTSPTVTFNVLRRVL